MKKIFKYPLKTTDTQEIIIPRESEILCVQTQNDTPCLWALVSVDGLLAQESRTIITYGTGHPITDSKKLKYLGTYQLQNGFLVFHLFEKLP